MVRMASSTRSSTVPTPLTNHRPPSRTTLIALDEPFPGASATMGKRDNERDAHVDGRTESVITAPDEEVELPSYSGSSKHYPSTDHVPEFPSESGRVRPEAFSTTFAVSPFGVAVVSIVSTVKFFVESPASCTSAAR